MRSSKPTAVMLLALALALEGCAATPTVLSGGQQQSLREIPLFGDNGSPHFAAYVACVAEDQSCATVNKSFAAWANDRGIDLHLVEADDILFKGGSVASKREGGKPYRLGFQIDPLVVPSFFQFRGGMHAQGGYKPPRVGYKATIYVFDAKGALLQALPVHQEITAKPDDPVNGYIQSQMNLLLSSIDPAYLAAGR